MSLTDAEKSARYRERHPERSRAASRVSESKRRAAGKVKAFDWRAWHLWTSYGITKDKYDEMVEAQAGLCAICGLPPASTLVVDHDHETNQIRALLCPSCNSALGFLRDQHSIALKAWEYLLTWKEDS